MSRFKIYKTRWNNKFKKNLKFKSLITPSKKKLFKIKYNKNFKNNFFFKTIKLKSNRFNIYKNILLINISSTFNNRKCDKLGTYYSNTLKRSFFNLINDNFFTNSSLFPFFSYFNNLILQKNIFHFLNNYSNKSKISLYDVTYNQLVKYKNFSPLLTNNGSNNTSIFKLKKKYLNNLNIFFAAKFFFKNLHNISKLKKLKRNFNYYKISKTDWFSGLWHPAV